MAVLTSIAIVSFNQKPALRALLTALDVEHAPNTEFVVVDNASFDGSAEMVAEEFPHARLVRLKTNKGFAAAANRAMLESIAPVVVLCQADIIATVHVLLELADRLREAAGRRAAAIFPRQLGKDKAEHPSVAPLPGLGRGMAGIFNPPAAAGAFVPFLDHVAPGEWGLLACAAFNADILQQIGGFDERFFLYYADADVCQRLHDRDYRILIAKDLSVVHLSAGQPLPPHLRRIMRKDQLHYFQKHRPFWQHDLLAAADQVRQWVVKE